jgi:hypothetical protein
MLVIIADAFDGYAAFFPFKQCIAIVTLEPIVGFVAHTGVFCAQFTDAFSETFFYNFF